MPYYRQKELLDETPLRFDLERPSSRAPRRCGFPARSWPTRPRGRLFIADSNHNRIVVARLDGTLLDVIGSGAAGRSRRRFRHGPVQPAARHGPGRQRRCTWPTPRTTCIRRVDLAAGKVTTVAGTGRQAREPAAARRGTADPRTHGPEQPLGPVRCTATISTSPWPAATRSGRCGSTARRSAPMRATAGRTSSTARCCRSRPYQAGLRLVRPAQRPGQRRQVALRGRQRRQFDPRRAARSAAARSARSSAPSRLPVARLFTFGDVDGPAAQVRFQHPLGVAFHDGTTLRGRHLQPQDPRRRSGRRDDADARRHAASRATTTTRPASSSRAGWPWPAGKLFVADTNNHLIRVIDLSSRRVSTLAIAGLKPGLRG